MSKLEKPEYRIVKLDKSNYNDLTRLHKAVYGVSVSNNHYLRKYDTSIIGLESVGFLAYNKNGLPIAFGGIIPCYIQYNNHLVPAGQSTDTMTHPDYRGKGLFLEINELRTTVCMESGIKLLFGFPNQNISPIFIHKLKWQQIGYMQCFEIKVNAIPFGKILNLHALTKIYEKYKARTLKKIIIPSSEIFSSVVQEGFSGVYKNEKFLEYKKYFGSVLIQTSAHTKAWIRINNNLMIGDILANENNIDEVILTLKKIALKVGVQKMFFQTSAGTNLYKLLLERYSSFETFPIMIKDLDSGIPLDSIKFTLGDIDIF